MDATCACGDLGARSGSEAAAQFIIACHCRACQQRSGAPFGAGVYFARKDIAMSGEAREYDRPTETGSVLRNHFCPRCGSTVWWTIDAAPGLVGIALGALTGPVPDVPIHSLWERSRHEWVELVGVTAHHLLGLPA